MIKNVVIMQGTSDGTHLKLPSTAIVENSNSNSQGRNLGIAQQSKGKNMITTTKAKEKTNVAPMKNKMGVATNQAKIGTLRVSNSLK